MRCTTKILNPKPFIKDKIHVLLPKQQDGLLEHGTLMVQSPCPVLFSQRKFLRTPNFLHFLLHFSAEEHVEKLKYS